MALRQGNVGKRVRGRGQRVIVRLAAVAVMFAAFALLIPIGSVHAAPLAAIDSGYPGAFGVDSCTALADATAELMPTRFYVAELGAGAYGLNCVEQDTISYVGEDYVHGYWGLTGPDGAPTDAYDYGVQQAQAAIDAWNNTPGVAGITIFADVEYGFSGWVQQPTPDQQAQNVQLLNGFLTTIAQAQFVPGVYINDSDKTGWFPADYISQVPFVYWVAGGSLSGTMCAPCEPICQTLPPVVEGWQSTVSTETFAGQKAEIWQYWLSGSGCNGDFNYTAQDAFHAFLPNV